MADPAKTADELLTAEQREEFLEALRQGIPPGLAARSIGFTGTKLRGCRHRDPVFAAECAAAMEEGNEHYRERLRASARTRALDPEGQTRILEIELATHGGAEYAHLRRDRVTFDGKVEHAILLSAAQIEALSEEKLAALDAILAEAEGALVVDGEFVELPALPPAGRNGNTPEDQ